jgi:hypothetical protein
MIGKAYLHTNNQGFQCQDLRSNYFLINRISRLLDQLVKHEQKGSDKIMLGNFQDCLCFSLFISDWSVSEFHTIRKISSWHWSLEASNQLHDIVQKSCVATFFLREKAEVLCLDALIERSCTEGPDRPKPHSYKATPYMLGGTERSAANPIGPTNARYLASA